MIILIVKDSPEISSGQAIPTFGTGQVMTEKNQIINR